MKSIGYPIVSFVNPIEAFDYFERNFTNCALVITDYGMPQMSGLDLIKKIREKDQNYGIKIILISATIKDNFITYYNDKLSDLKIDNFLEKLIVGGISPRSYKIIYNYNKLQTLLNYSNVYCYIVLKMRILKKD